MKWRKINRITHRDIGYLIAGMTIIYAVSGIALNHKNDFNPNYVIDQGTFTTGISFNRDEADEEKVQQLLEELGEKDNYKTYYYPRGTKLTVFLIGGQAVVDTQTGEGYVERISRRPVLYQFNFLHYNPGIWWKWFSDIFCVSLVLVTVTGLFIVKGKNGITRRGALLTAAGIILPLLFLLIY